MKRKLAILIALAVGLAAPIPLVRALAYDGAGRGEQGVVPILERPQDNLGIHGGAQGVDVVVSPPVQVTGNQHYERGESILYDGTHYWLFYGRSESFTGTYESGNPDIHDYQVYYKKADSIPRLITATAEIITGTSVLHNENGYLGETGAAYFDGEVWAFATVISGTSACLYGWYTGDGGTTWGEVGPILTGLSSGQAHHDETAFNGELWVVEGSGNFTTMHTSTPKTGGWSTPLSVDDTLTGGLAHFFVEGDDLYLAIYSASRNYIYKYNQATTGWDKIDEISPPEKYDPTLFKVGNSYVFAQAPWDGVRQYIIAWSNDVLDDTFFEGGHTPVTEGRYGTNPWVDMWPIGFTTPTGESYLFFTSERNPDDPTAEIDGNIWYLRVDWDLSQDHYTYIQEAVNAAGDGEVIGVGSGTYVEQVEITKTITLSGTGMGTTIIHSPDDLPLYFTTGSRENHPVVYIHDVTSATIQGVTVDGAGNGNDNFRFAGIAFHNAGGTLDEVEVKDVRDTPFSGSQHGVSVYVFNDDAFTRTLQVYDSLLTGFQKNGMALNAASDTGLVVDVRGNIVTGSGITDTIAQNGIQVWADLGTGTIADNTVSEIAYDGSGWVATAILDYYGDLTITGNTVLTSQVGIYSYDGTSSIGCNRVEVVDAGDYSWGIIASDPPHAVPSPFGAGDGVLSLSSQAPTAQDALQTPLVVEVYSNTVLFAGSTNTAIYGIEADAGWGPDDLVFTATYNIVEGFEGGINLYQCVGGTCDTGTFSGIAIHRNCLSDNTYGMTSTLASTVTAEVNYWGHPSGPYHPTLNPHGQGDEVRGDVDFDPWLLACGSDYLSGGRTIFLPLVVRGW